MVVLGSVAPNVKNITVIGEGPIEEWVAIKGGGFKKSLFDMPALLYENDLLHLYDALLHLELYELWTRYEKDRVEFLEYLKAEVGISSLADRQHLANALGRAKRLGTFDNKGLSAKL